MKKGSYNIFCGLPSLHTLDLVIGHLRFAPTGARTPADPVMRRSVSHHPLC